VAAAVEELTPARARAIGEAARRRVLAEHTYAHRAAELERLLDAVDQPRGAVA
jgi:spore maturation protein CgeB